MKEPVFDIRIGVGARDTFISVNGQDISHALRGLKVESRGELTHVTLMVRPGAARMTVMGAMDSDECR